jgi:SagB-type dehydrogenase family enzyme
MNNRLYFLFSIVLTLLMVASAVPSADKLNPIKLPPPQLDGGKTLMQALKARHSSRSFADKELSNQTLSNLLWAAFGINRPETGKRTAPSAHNKQDIDVYVATPKGLYLYHAKGHSLEPILADDIRAATGKQGYVAKAAVNLVYVADLKKTSGDSEQQKMFIAAADTGFIGQNVYLYCASAGLVTVIRASIDRPALAKIMKLREDQRIILAQSVGYFKDASSE